MLGRIDSWMKGKYSANMNEKLELYIGCTLGEFKSYIGSKMQPHMTWGNRGKAVGKWQLKKTRTKEHSLTMCHE